MKEFALVIGFLLSFGLISAQQLNDPNELKGLWKVDLRPSPDAAEYFQEMNIKKVKDNKLKGSFYGSEFSTGRINDEWGTVHVGFITTDGTSEYYHTGYLINDTIFGITHCPGRDLLAPWKATKIEE